MTVKLHELIDQLASGHRRMAHDVERSSAIVLFNAVSRRAPTAICFYMGEIDDVTNLPMPSGDLIRLPYPVCWFEGSATSERGEDRWGALCWDDEDQIVAAVFARPSRGDWGLFGSSYFRSDEQGGHMRFHPPLDAKTSAGAFFGVCCYFLGVLNCVNARHVRIDPPEKLQNARSRKGKRPLFSYWTLQLNLGSRGQVRQSLGGHQEPPRIHLRRGHFKKRKSGTFWWRPHVSGTSSGIVHKDYTT